MTSVFRAALIGAAIVLSAPTLGTAQPVPAPAAARAETALRLSAYGEIKVAPNLATVTAGVATTAPTAAEALRQNREKMTATLAALGAAGVGERDIQTVGLVVQPVYRQPTLSSGGRRVLEGYRASNKVKVVLDDVERLGPVIDAMVAAGANEVDSITLGVRDLQAVQDGARREAVRRLRQKAELYAEASGLQLAGLRELTEGSALSHPDRRFQATYGAESGYFGAIDLGTPIEPGQMTIRVDVSGVYVLE